MADCIYMAYVVQGEKVNGAALGATAGESSFPS
jgi:hypothetical protein